MKLGSRANIFSAEPNQSSYLMSPAKSAVPGAPDAFRSNGNLFSPPPELRQTNTPLKPDVARRVMENLGQTPMKHDSAVKNYEIPQQRQKALQSCFGSTGMGNALFNPHSNMGKDMVATKNTNKPQVLFDAVKKGKEEWKAKPK